MNFFSELKFKEIAKEVVAASHVLYRRGWTPAASGNVSMRIDEAACGVTQSGTDKERLKEAAVVAVDFKGKPLTKGRPSSETALHTLLYQLYTSVGAVLHVHSPNSTVLSKMLKTQSQLVLKDYQLLKAFDRGSTSETEMSVPIFENTLDLKQLAITVEKELKGSKTTLCGYMIRGHGLFVWGKTMTEAIRRLEAFDFLLGCEIALHRQ